MSTDVPSNGSIVAITSTHQENKSNSSIDSVSRGGGGSVCISSSSSSSDSCTKFPHSSHYYEYPIVMSVIPESMCSNNGGPGDHTVHSSSSSTLRTDQDRLMDASTTACSTTTSSSSSSIESKSKDTTLTKIFVGGLPYHTTDKSLHKFFETFGEIEEAVVITDRQTGKSRGYGFVSIPVYSLSFYFSLSLITFLFLCDSLFFISISLHRVRSHPLYPQPTHRAVLR